MEKINMKKRKPTKLPDPFDQTRHLAWNQMRTQAGFRGEDWQLPFEHFCEFWPNKEIWAQRGRGVNDLCLTRKNVNKSWSKDNCHMVTRRRHLLIKNRRTHNLSVDHLFHEG